MSSGKTWCPQVTGCGVSDRDDLDPCRAHHRQQMPCHWHPQELPQSANLIPYSGEAGFDDLMTYMCLWGGFERQATPWSHLTFGLNVFKPKSRAETAPCTPPAIPSFISQIVASAPRHCAMCWGSRAGRRPPEWASQYTCLRLGPARCASYPLTPPAAL